jgi:hypothetical protein
LPNGTKFENELRNELLGSNEFSRGAAAVISQGRKPLDSRKK